jgi:peptidoglycan/xylan/chitin deacetylase (PgdA/CDA1 family)
VRFVVKRAVEVALCRSGIARLARSLRSQDVLVLAYHNVVPGGARVRGERSLHISQDELHRQLSLLSRTHQFVPVDSVPSPGSGRPRVAVTFDDAYRGAVQLGVEVLSDLAVPATIFVAPAWLGARRFWWDVLSHDRELEPWERERALTENQGKAEQVLAAAGHTGDPDGSGSPHTRTAGEEDLDAAMGFAGLTVGSHSWSHPNLATLEEPELEEEVGRPLDWLRKRWQGRVVDWLSYPYGRRSPQVVEVARRVGYVGGFRIEGGWVKGRVPPFETPRLNVPAGLSLEGFQIRSAGLIPL